MTHKIGLVLEGSRRGESDRGGSWTEWRFARLEDKSRLLEGEVKRNGDNVILIELKRVQKAIKSGRRRGMEGVSKFEGAKIGEKRLNLRAEGEGE